VGRLRFVLTVAARGKSPAEAPSATICNGVEGQESKRRPESHRDGLPETDGWTRSDPDYPRPKGLEFPIVILSGLTTLMASRPRRVEVASQASEGWAIRLSKRMSTSDSRNPTLG